MGLLSLEKRRLWEDLIAACQYFKWDYEKRESDFFAQADSKRTKGNGLKVREKRFRIRFRKDFPSVRGMRHWNRRGR